MYNRHEIMRIDVVKWNDKNQFEFFFKNSKVSVKSIEKINFFDCFRLRLMMI
jgi:hypothetical protein